VVCSLAVWWLSLDDARGQAAGEAATQAMIDMIWLLP
jgi:hypothetical protein